MKNAQLNSLVEKTKQEVEVSRNDLIKSKKDSDREVSQFKVTFRVIPLFLCFVTG